MEEVNKEQVKFSLNSSLIYLKKKGPCNEMKSSECHYFVIVKVQRYGNVTNYCHKINKFNHQFSCKTRKW